MLKVLRRISLAGFMILPVCVLYLLAGRNANAQSDERVTSAEQAFRAAISAQVTAAARSAGVALLPVPMTYAGGEGVFLINAAVQGADGLQAQSTEKGTDLLFVYIGASGLAVSEGYYKVRLKGTKAQFIASNGNVAAVLAAQVDQSTTAQQKPHIKLTGSVSKNGGVIDIEITFGKKGKNVMAVTIPIPQASLTR